MSRWLKHDSPSKLAFYETFLLHLWTLITLSRALGNHSKLEKISWKIYSSDHECLVDPERARGANTRSLRSLVNPASASTTNAKLLSSPKFVVLFWTPAVDLKEVHERTDAKGGALGTAIQNEARQRRISKSTELFFASSSHLQYSRLSSTKISIALLRRMLH
ncbi:hypothetical protein C8R45DRAFT_1216455 [Mycena sanguinolenta]|nr:hypothetical protein C8R45DRAFT_1216455 [Mycena sanguinolenta]